MSHLFLIAVSILLVLARFHGIKTEAFQAAAHLWVGGLIVAWFMGTDKQARKIYGWLVIGLSVAEVTAFILTKIHGA